MADRVAELAAELEAELDDALTGDGHTPRDAGRAATALERAVAACRTDPRIAEEFDLSGLLDELAEVYAQLGRVDDALSTMRAAITAGYQSTPDPRCRLAEIQLRAGRPEPAHALYAQVHAEFPDDVWLYNNAGLEYGAVGDHVRALAWLTPGLELALATGDPERLVDQLADLREHSRTALGQPRDDLDDRAEQFLARPRSDPSGWSPAALPAVFAALAATPSTPLAPTALVPPGPPTARPRVALAVAWFPASEFPTALQLWPQLAQDWGTTDYTGYNRQLERHLRELSMTAPGPTFIVPIRIEAFQRWCRRTDRDPATSEARAGYAADQARTQAHDLIIWPPERNQPCWCHSGRKYKKCCAHPTALTATE
jgi:tetratricopeptide (TPR) repeat protein